MLSVYPKYSAKHMAFRIANQYVSFYMCDKEYFKVLPKFLVT